MVDSSFVAGAEKAIALGRYPELNLGTRKSVDRSADLPMFDNYVRMVSC